MKIFPYGAMVHAEMILPLRFREEVNAALLAAAKMDGLEAQTGDDERSRTEFQDDYLESEWHKDLWEILISNEDPLLVQEVMFGNDPVYGGQWPFTVLWAWHDLPEGHGLPEFDLPSRVMEICERANPGDFVVGRK